MSSTIRNRTWRSHDARSDYCQCKSCRATRAAAARRIEAERVAALAALSPREQYEQLDGFELGQLIAAGDTLAQEVFDARLARRQAERSAQS